MRYVELIDAVEEGLKFVDVNYQERNYGTGDQLLEDLLKTFGPFHESNMEMQSIFFRDGKLFQQFQTFQQILDQVQHLQSISHDETTKVTFLHEFFLPSYIEWKSETYNQIKKYMIN